MPVSADPPATPTITFSGHETFALRGSWLKKAYDLLQRDPGLFAREDAFVRLGVGKNMATSIRFWGRACAVFERAEEPGAFRPTWLGDALFDDEAGWDPFLITPAARWLLHWQIAARPEAAFTWFYTFNLLRRGEIVAAQLGQQIVEHVARLGARPPSDATIGRDVDCMLRCYVRPDLAQPGLAVEDALLCPLHDLGLIQQVPGQPSYRLVAGAHPDLPDHLVAYAALQQARALGRVALSFNDLAYGERSPGRVFRLDEDALLARLLRLEGVTGGRAAYAEQGGIRQLLWRAPEDLALDAPLLAAAFAQERPYV